MVGLGIVWKKILKKKKKKKNVRPEHPIIPSLPTLLGYGVLSVHDGAVNDLVVLLLVSPLAYNSKTRSKTTTQLISFTVVQVS